MGKEKKKGKKEEKGQGKTRIARSRMSADLPLAVLLGLVKEFTELVFAQDSLVLPFVLTDVLPRNDNFMITLLH